MKPTARAQQQPVVTVEDVQNRYRFWRKYASTLYDLVSTHTVNAPVPCVEIIDVDKGDWSELLPDPATFSSSEDSEQEEEEAEKEPSISTSTGSSTRKRTRIASTTTTTTTTSRQQQSVSTVAKEWSPAHSRLLAVGAAGYDTQSSIEFFQCDIPPSSSSSSVSSSSSTVSPSRVRTRQLFSAAAGANQPDEELLVFRPHPQRSTLLASTNQKGLSVWDFEGRSTDFKCTELSNAYGQALAWQQDRLILGTHSGGVVVFNVATAAAATTTTPDASSSSTVHFTELSSEPHGGKSVFAVECYSANEFLTAAGDGSICQWDLREAGGGSRRRTTAHGEFGVSCLSTVREFQFLSAAGLNAVGHGPTNPEVKLWDVRKLQDEAATFTSRASSSVHSDDHGCAVHQVRWDPHHANEFASCSEDGAVRLWDVSKQHGAAAAVAADGDAAADGPSELLFVHAGHVGAVTDFQYDVKYTDRTVVSASDENVMIWRPLLSNFNN